MSGPARLALAVAFALLAAVVSVNPIANNDIWLHLETGSLILERGRVPQVDEYTWSRAGAPYVAHEWLSQVFFVLVFRIGGIAGLSVTKYIVTAATLWIVYLATAREAGDGLPATLAACAALLLLTSHLSIRPHLFTFLMTATFVLILRRLDGAAPGSVPESWLGRRAGLIALAGLQILWANLHGGFVAGILLGLIHAAARVVRRPRLREAAVAMVLPLSLTAASMVNPYGPRLLATVAKFNDPFFRKAIVEWQSPLDARDLTSPILWLYLGWLAASLAAAVWAWRSGDVAASLGALAFAALSISSRRHVSLLAIVTAPLLGGAAAAAAGRLRSRRRRRPARRGRLAPAGPHLAVAGLVLLLASTGLITAEDKTSPWTIGIAPNIPVEALDFMRAERLRGRVYTDMGFGGYVTWRGWPDLTTSIDSRLEVFGGEFIERSLQTNRDPEAFQRFASAGSFDFALLPWRKSSVSGAVSALAAASDWSLVYFDDVAALYARRTEALADLIARRGCVAIDPIGFMAGRGAGRTSDAPAMEAEARRAVADPHPAAGRPEMNAVAHAMLGAALMRQGRHAEAAAELRAAVLADPRVIPAHGMLALALLRTGDRAGARAALLEMKRRAPDSPLADQILQEIDRRP